MPGQFVRAWEAVLLHTSAVREVQLRSSPSLWNVEPY